MFSESERPCIRSCAHDVGGPRTELTVLSAELTARWICTMGFLRILYSKQLQACNGVNVLMRFSLLTLSNKFKILKCFLDQWDVLDCTYLSMVCCASGSGTLGYPRTRIHKALMQSFGHILSPTARIISLLERSWKLRAQGCELE